MPYLRPYSLRNIEQMIRLHTPQWLKDMCLAEISVLEADKALSMLPNGRTRVYARQVWHSAFLKACKLGIVERNVVDYTDIIRYRKKRGSPLTVSERREFLKAIHGKRIEWVMLFYLLTGVRRNEALSVRWSDIDEAEGVVLIRGTKTEDSYREIPLTDSLKEIFAAQRKQNEKDKHFTGRGKLNKGNDDFVFHFSAGYLSYRFKELCPAHHLHDLRHTYVTLCAESGVNIRVCQQLVGHKSADITLNIYTHVMDD